ncbi:MAG: DNA integrity scanning diadenylate cyclase DisA [Cellulomonadaceae bacterium]|nr:DNA integrity scanning diadenylate cyclase DisA [Cellulomonadaceae bacterium]
MRDDEFRAILAMVAPGTDLRDGLDRTLRGGTGALIVLGRDKAVDAMCSGGFALDVPFSPARLRELCKMDGAVILSSDATRITQAAVQLLPDAGIETTESGTRHRTAERVARQTGFPVISVSHSMNTTALYLDGERHLIEASEAILGRANQALATLERYRTRLDEVAATLSALEIEDLVTVRDVCTVVQRLEMVRRISEEIHGYVTVLGVDGRLLSLQLNELTGGTGADQSLVLRDYMDVAKGGRRSLTEVQEALAAINSDGLLDLPAIATAVALPTTDVTLDIAVSPLGYRILSKIPRLPATIVDRIVTYFGGLQKLLGATVDDLMTVEGVGEQRARAVREGLSRLAETSILERYV